MGADGDIRSLLEQERSASEANIRSERAAMMEMMARERQQMEDRMATEKVGTTQITPALNPKP